MRPIRIAVSGGASASAEVLQLAFQVGVECARAGAILLTGGGGGVMAAAGRGAKSAGGMTVGIFPHAGEGTTPDEIDLPIHTGIGQARNLVLVLSAEAVIAIGGEWGTLSEIALASKHGRPVIALTTWKLDPPDDSLSDLPIEVKDAAGAVAAALEMARRNRTAQ